MKNQCNFPKCKQQTQGTWALVPLCTDHLETIQEETDLYYIKKLTYEGRENYLQIAERIPWSRRG